MSAIEPPAYARSHMDERRSEARFRFELTVTLTAGRRTWELSTHDVSYRGMFVSLDDPPRPRELVRVDAVLPEGDRLTLQGMVAFVTSKVDDVGRPPGVGIRFLGSGGPEHDQWEGFVRKVWEEQHRRKPRKRTGAHVTVVVRLRAKDTAELEDGITSVLSHAGLSVETEHTLVVAAPIALEIVHPHTGEVFDLPCVVRKRPDGVGIGLVDVGTAQKRALAEFVSSGAKAPSRR